MTRGRFQKKKDDQEKNHFTKKGSQNVEIMVQILSRFRRPKPARKKNAINRPKQQKEKENGSWQGITGK